MTVDELSPGISFIGTGRLAWSLIPACQAAGVRVEGIYGRSASRATTYAKVYNLSRSGGLPARIPSRLVILCVADQAISEVAKSLALDEGQMICHCSGSVSLDRLGDHPLRGVLYPMQAFTDKKVVNFQTSTVPIFIEGSTQAVVGDLHQLASRLSQRVQVLPSEQRRTLHLGAVLACNFTNLLFGYAAKQVKGVGLEAYESLIRHQLDQALALGPASAQTGPAHRGDVETLRTHLKLLEDQPDLQQLYTMLSRMINPDLPDPF